MSKCPSPIPADIFGNVAYMDRFKRMHISESPTITGTCQREAGHRGKHIFEYTAKEGQFLMLGKITWPQKRKRHTTTGERK